MNRFFSSDRISFFYCKYEYLIVICFVLVWQTLLLRASNGLFLETDSYTHAMRLMDLIQSGSWQETLYRHDNCPFGQMLHFTRLADMFLYMTTLPFLPFMPVKQAIFYGGFLFNPVIAGLTAAALIWTGRAFSGAAARAAGIVLYFLLPFVSNLFLAGRPDHHVLLNLLLIIISGCLIHGAKTQKTAYYKTAGIFCGLSVWATPEGFLASGFLYAGLLFAWLFRYQNMRQIRLLSQYFFVTTTICLLVNPPMQGLFHPDNGRLSILIVSMLGCAFLSFYIEEFFEREKYIRSCSCRIFSLSLMTALSFAGILFLYGKNAVFSSPIPQEIYEIWASRVSELKPGYHGNIFKSDSIIFLYLCTAACIVFFFSDLRTKKLLIELCFPLFLFSVLILFSVRFVRTASVFAAVLLPLVAFAFSSNKELASNIPSLFKPALCFILICLYIAGIFFSCANQQKFGKRITNPAEFLAYLPPDKGCVLTSSDRGPETAWGTDRSVIGSPYHSNPQGIIDSYTFLYSIDPIQVQNILKQRKVSLIILDTPEAHYSISKKHPGFMGSPSFGAKLVTGRDIPCYIQPVTDIPEKIKEKHIIFSVDFTKCPAWHNQSR